MKIKRITSAAIVLLIIVVAMASCTQGGSEAEPAASDTTTLTATPDTDATPIPSPAATATLQASPTIPPTPTITASPTEAAAERDDPTATVTGETSQMPESGEIVVIFQRSGGFVGDATTWRLYTDGTIEVNRNGGNDETFEQVTTVDSGDVQALLDSLQERGFFRLEGNYMPKDPCCDRFLYELTVLQDGQRRHVETVGGTEGIPQEVWDSIELVQDFFDRQPTQ